MPWPVISATLLRMKKRPKVDRHGRVSGRSILSTADDCCLHRDCQYSFESGRGNYPGIAMKESFHLRKDRDEVSSRTVPGAGRYCAVFSSPSRCLRKGRLSKNRSPGQAGHLPFPERGTSPTRVVRSQASPRQGSRRRSSRVGISGAASQWNVGRAEFFSRGSIGLSL